MNLNLSELPPLPIILVIAGLLFLLLGVVQSIGGRIKVSPQKQLPALIIGIILIALGLFFYTTNIKSNEVSVITETPTITTDPTELINSNQNQSVATFSPTNTAAEIPTSTTSSQNIFQDGCIDKNSWFIIQGNSASTKNNCWDLENKGITAVSSKGLFINVSAQQSSISYGIVKKISTVSDIKFDIQINKISTISEWNTNVAIGLLPSLTSTPNPDGTSILFQAEKPNSPIWMMLQLPNQNHQIYLPPPRLQPNQIYNVKLELRGRQLTTFLNNERIDDRNLNNDYSFLWIGYTVPEGGVLSTIISNFSIDNR